jgi:uncharacterized protein YjbI with pentapeptide repeats
MIQIIDEINDLRSDDIIGPLEAAEFLQVSEDDLMNAVLQGYLPGACISGKWRFSKWGLKKFCLQRNNHALGAPWESKASPFECDDWLDCEAQDIVNAYKDGKRYFPCTSISGANFSNLDLAGIDFWDSDLRGANFSGCNLQDAVFFGTNLESAIFVGANLTDTDFREASLAKSNLSGATLKRTNLEGAKLENATLNRVKVDSILL